MFWPEFRYVPFEQKQFFLCFFPHQPLSSPGIESGKAEIEIPDCDPTLMKYLLQYIYAEKVTIPEGIDNALELLWCGDGGFFWRVVSFSGGCTHQCCWFVCPWGNVLAIFLHLCHLASFASQSTPPLR